MQSTAEFGDSGKELRQVECCVHGKPCAFASRLSREKAEEAKQDSHYLIGSGYKSFPKNSEENVNYPDDISHSLSRKIEREAVGHPRGPSNFRASIIRASEIEDIGSQPSRSTERNFGTKVEHLYLPKTTIDHGKKLTSAKERHSQYEMMHPPSLALSKEQTGWITRTQDISPSVEAYIGVLTAKEAEQYVVKPASFKLYHMMPQIESLNSVLPSLGLYIIYRSGTGRIYHYPIRQRKQHMDYSTTGSRVSVLNNLKVEYGDPMAPWFFTLDALVSYYNIYVHLHEVQGEYVADIFPTQ